jgi:membrane protease YdiL (CAAX protease family)
MDRSSMSQEERKRVTVGLFLFVAFTFLGSWFVAATLRVFELNVMPATVGTRLFTTSLLYALSMGWQPVVATWIVRRWIDPPDRLDLGLRPARRGFNVVGGLGAVVFAVSAALVAVLLATLGLVGSAPVAGLAEADLAGSTPSIAGSALLFAALLATIALVFVQAFAEEIGWRGYFLPRAMERFGAWRGLVLHGVVWGLWYAPVLFFATYGELDPFGSIGRSLGFVLTCMLLGVLFGWLRLASRSIAPVMVANTTLTLLAGLPYVVHGVDAGLRSAAFGPPGWLVLAIAIAALAVSKWKSAVQTPARPAPFERSPALLVKVWNAIDPNEGRKNRLLH